VAVSTEARTRCAQCGAETGAGTTFTFYFGTHATTRAVDGGTARTTGSNYLIAGSEQVFLCTACQIAQRHRDSLNAAVVCAAVTIASPVVIGLAEYPSLAPWSLAQALSALGRVVLSMPVVEILVGLAIMAGVGALAKQAIRAFGDVFWVAVTWRKPYAVSGEDPDLDQTSKGEAFAIRLRRAALQRQGYDAFFTRKACRALGRTSWAAGIVRVAWVQIVLFALFLLVLVFLGLGSVLVGQLSRP